MHNCNCETTETKTEDDKMKKTLTILVYLILSSVIILTYFYYVTISSTSFPPSRLLVSKSSLSESIVNSSYRIFKKEEVDYTSCFSGFEGGKLGNDIASIYEKVVLLKSSKYMKCTLIYKIFDNIFTIEKIEAPLVLPESFISQVKGWLNGDLTLLSEVRNQKVFKVVNKITGEESIYNPLRSKRPTSKSKINPIKYLDDVVIKSELNCDFCDYKKHTAEDIFGRIENNLTVTASNTFKLARFHGLIFPRQHNPLNLSLETLEELFLTTAKSWFEKAYDTDSSQIYPSLLWDNLPHAGASQVHPHIHGILDDAQYAGPFEVLNKGAKNYIEMYQESYWVHLSMIHQILGLAEIHGDSIIFTPLNARKDYEFMIIAPNLSKNAIELLYLVLKSYRNKLNVFCFSSGASLPPLNSYVNGLPFVFRIGSRGDCTTVGSDVSSLELYTVNNINSDMAKTIRAIRTTVK